MVESRRRHFYAPTSVVIDRTVRRSYTDPCGQIPRRASRLPRNDDYSPTRPDLVGLPDSSKLPGRQSFASVTTLGPEEEELDPASPSSQRSLEVASVPQKPSTRRLLQFDDNNQPIENSDAGYDAAPVVVPELPSSGRGFRKKCAQSARQYRCPHQLLTSLIRSLLQLLK
jgi:hypothetical protein